MLGVAVLHSDKFIIGLSYYLMHMPKFFEFALIVEINNVL
jgi:hypothetical protein